jgi:O-acetyl-ADP-ribose deacetylase (regulator of RNase III)
VQLRVEALQGDITDCEADAIVNAANNHLWMGSGVAGAIKRKGGHAIEEEAVAKGPIPVGQAVATSAGRLKARYVIHAAGMGQDLAPTEDSIRDSTANALKRADELSLRSVVFPLIGCGVGGFPVSKSAALMLDAVAKFSRRDTTIERITFALFSKADYDKFRDILSKRSV